MTEEKIVRKEVAHDETPSGITDHAFEPRGEWYTLCAYCGLAEAAHAETTVDSFVEIQADHVRQLERKREHEGGRVRIGYYSDDNPDD